MHAGGGIARPRWVKATIDVDTAETDDDRRPLPPPQTPADVSDWLQAMKWFAMLEPPSPDATRPRDGVSARQFVLYRRAQGVDFRDIAEYLNPGMTQTVIVYSANGARIGLKVDQRAIRRARALYEKAIDQCHAIANRNGL